MIEKPNIRDERIIITVREHYSVPVIGIEFLPIGNDPSAWAYRVAAENRDTYFLKIRKEIENQAGFLVPRFLQDHGIAQVLAPLPTKKQELWARLEDFFLILYPFVPGTEAMEIGMADSQWKEFGSILKRIHDIKLPSDLSQHVRRETFIPSWGPFAKELHVQIREQEFDDPYQKELAMIWKENKQVIQVLIERIERMGRHIQQMDLEFVLCHADIHTANILLTPEQQMFIVDWDGTLLAPRERDLMFVLEGDAICTHEEQMFFDGYGITSWNQLVLAYYRYEWCIQEIGDYGKRVFSDVGEKTKQESLAAFRNLFSPENVIETALHTSLEI